MKYARQAIFAMLFLAGPVVASAQQSDTAGRPGASGVETPPVVFSNWNQYEPAIRKAWVGYQHEVTSYQSAKRIFDVLASSRGTSADRATKLEVARRRMDEAYSKASSQRQKYLAIATGALNFAAAEEKAAKTRDEQVRARGHRHEADYWLERGNHPIQ